MGASTYNEWEASHHRNNEEADLDHDQDIDFSKFGWNSKNVGLSIILDRSEDQFVHNNDGCVSDRAEVPLDCPRGGNKVEKWNSFINEVQKMSIEIDDTNEEFI